MVCVLFQYISVIAAGCID